MPIFWRDQMLEWYFQAKLIGIVIWGGCTDNGTHISAMEDVTLGGDP